jgi:hypothetical protein
MKLTKEDKELLKKWEHKSRLKKLQIKQNMN